jgi:hypothetical protein
VFYSIYVLLTARAVASAQPQRGRPMLNPKLIQTQSPLYNRADDSHEADARLDRAVNALLMVMAIENANMFEGVAEVTPDFGDLEKELASLQAIELRSAYERVAEAEVALEQALAVVDAAGEAEMNEARAQVEAVENEMARLRAEATTLENEFEPHYQSIAHEIETEQNHAAELRAKASALNAEARSQFEAKVELVLKARLRPFEERYATLDAERAARRNPLEQQLNTLNATKRELEEHLERMKDGATDAQKRAAEMRTGRAGEGAVLYAAVCELLVVREQFSDHVGRIEKSLDAAGRMSAIAKRHAGLVEQARLELDAPVNAEGALKYAKDGSIADAARLLELAVRGGLDVGKANEIRNEIARAEYAALVWEWEQDLLQRARELNGMSMVRRYHERIAQKAQDSNYQRLPRDLNAALAQAEKLAGQGVAARRRALEAHAAQYINSQNKFFSAQVMPDSGKLMIAVKKNGQWLRHALCTVVEAEGGYEIKTSYYERKTPLDDQAEWDKRRARFERHLPRLMGENDAT